MNLNKDKKPKVIKRKMSCGVTYRLCTINVNEYEYNVMATKRLKQ